MVYRDFCGSDVAQSVVIFNMKKNQKKLKGAVRLAIQPPTNNCSSHAWHELAALLESKQTLTLVIGAGIHKVLHHDDPKIYESCLLLSSWLGLLSNTFPHFVHSKSPSLSWELCIQADSSKLSAKAREMSYMRKVRELVATAEEPVLRSHYFDARVARVLKSQKISDIVSLNFDLIAEQLLSKSGADRSTLSQKTKTSERHRKVGSKRIWHPHGDRGRIDLMHLGLRQYGLVIKPVEAARRKFKEWERKQKDKSKSPFSSKEPSNWIDLMIGHHLIFIGCSLDFSEWDMWFALVNRWRNYAIPKNKRYEPKTFVLTTGKNHKHLPSQFLRLDAPKYEDGWKWLGDMLNKSTDGRG